MGLIATFMGRELQTARISAMVAVASWLSVLGFLALGTSWLRRDWQELQGRPPTVDSEPETLLREAQHEYLKGHCLEAETLVAKLIARCPRDVEARLLLASVMRRTKRWNQAQTTLVELRAEPRAAAWLPEIESELRQIEGQMTEAGDERRKAA